MIAHRINSNILSTSSPSVLCFSVHFVGIIKQQLTDLKLTTFCFKTCHQSYPSFLSSDLPCLLITLHIFMPVMSFLIASPFFSHHLLYTSLPLRSFSAEFFPHLLFRSQLSFICFPWCCLWVIFFSADTNERHLHIYLRAVLCIESQNHRKAWVGRDTFH